MLRIFSVSAAHLSNPILSPEASCFNIHPAFFAKSFYNFKSVLKNNQIVKRIIHLSDIHVGYDDCGIKFRTLIDNITFLKQPARNYIILITGDIVDNAHHTEYIEEAVEAVRILEERGYKVLVVPGNHDYGTGTIGNRKFVGLFKGKYYSNRKTSYPKLDIIDKIAFIGLDSTAEELHWLDRFLSDGELGERQLARLKKILNKPEVRNLKKVVYLHHHPFDFKLAMYLKDSNELKSIIENKIDMLLFGHYHADPSSAGKIYHGMWGIRRCYNAGSSTHKNGNTGFQRIINLSDADPRKDYDGNFI
jgi:predicted MPP superfamily phosphohydrolase